jgi:lysophospholipase L1-like esterase
MKIEPGSRLVMIGDSVTAADRQDDGEGLFDAIGHGYVGMVDALLMTSYPDYAIRVTNRGVSGNTIRELSQRWQRDVLDLKPEWLSVMIGINDVWRQFDMPRQPEAAVLPDEYERVYDDLLEQTRPYLQGLVLMTPYYIEADRDDAMRHRMDEYGVIVRRLAAKHNAILVDTQGAFNFLLKYMHSASIGWDRIHPNSVGHMALAKAFLNAVDFDWGRIPETRNKI